MGHIQHSSVIEAPRAEVFKFLSEYKNRALILPKSKIEMEVISAPTEPIKKGDEIQVKITRFGIYYPLRYIIEECDAPHFFIERQTSGIFENWLHTFKFEEHSDKSTLVTNLIDYAFPLGIFGALFDDLYFRNDTLTILKKTHENLQKIF